MSFYHRMDTEDGMNPDWRRLDLARYRLGWSYADLGAYFGVSNSTAYYWCKGVTPVPFHACGNLPYLEAAADHFEAQVQAQQQAQQQARAQQQAQQQRQQMDQLGDQLLKLGAVAGLVWLATKMFTTAVVDNLLTKTGKTDDD